MLQALLGGMGGMGPMGVDPDMSTTRTPGDFGCAVNIPCIVVHGELKAGDIPPGLKSVTLDHPKTLKFDEDALAGLEEVFLRDINEHMIFPKSDLKVFLFDYKGRVDLPQDRCTFYIEKGDLDAVKQPIRHFAFKPNKSSISELRLSSSRFINGPETIIDALGKKITVVERTPIESYDWEAKQTGLTLVVHKKKQWNSDVAKAFKSVNLRLVRLELKAADLEGVEELYLASNKNIEFPSTIKRLFIKKPSGVLPVGCEIYVHANFENRLTQHIEHYVYFNGDETIPDDRIESDIFESVGEQYLVYAFETYFRVLKRRPKEGIEEPQADETAEEASNDELIKQMIAQNRELLSALRRTRCQETPQAQSDISD